MYHFPCIHRQFFRHSRPASAAWAHTDMSSSRYSSMVIHRGVEASARKKNLPVADRTGDAGASTSRTVGDVTFTTDHATQSLVSRAEMTRPSGSVTV